MYVFVDIDDQFLDKTFHDKFQHFFEKYLNNTFLFFKIISHCKRLHMYYIIFYRHVNF